MRRVIFASLVLAAGCSGLPARGQILMQQQGGLIEDFDGPVGQYPNNNDAQMRQMIQQILQSPHVSGDSWSWRDGVEDHLVSLGPGALDAIRGEMESHDGFELDALEVAAFRLVNPPLNPHDALTEWAQRHFGIHTSSSAGQAPPPAIKIARIFDMRRLFPHHLFYVIEYAAKHARLVVALAADGKVQELEDDAALTRFIQAEVPAQHTPLGRERLSASAAKLAAARSSTIYHPDNLQTEDEKLTYRTTFEADGLHQVATVTFDPSGGVIGIATSQDKSPPGPAAPPVSVPTSLTAPPPIPG